MPRPAPVVWQELEFHAGECVRCAQALEQEEERLMCGQGREIMHVWMFACHQRRQSVHRRKQAGG